MTILHDGNGNSITQENPMPTMIHGDAAMVMRDSKIDPSHLLGANATYKSPVIDRPRQIIPDGMTRLWIKSSSSGVLYLEEHNNYDPANPDTGWTTLATVTVSATVSALMAWSTLTKQYMRFKFVNGAVAQTEFILNHYTQGVGVTPVMVADGADVTQGAKNETAVIDPTASASVTARLGGLLKQWQGDGPVGKAAPVSIVGSLANPSATITIGTGAAHSAGDVVSTDVGQILQLDTGLPAGSSGVILSSLVKLGQNAVFSGGAGYTLYLFDTSPVVQATNAAFDLVDADLTSYIGKIPISTLQDLGSNCAITDLNQNFPFKLASGDTKLYGKLACVGGETTVTGKIITIKLKIAVV